MAIACALLAAFVLGGCGDSGQPEVRVGDEARKQGFEGRQVKIFALAKHVCEVEPRSETAVNEGLPADAGVVKIARRYAAEWPGKIRGAAFEGCLAGLGEVPARFPRSSPAARDIWGRHFIAISVAEGEDGEEPPVAEPVSIRLTFGTEKDHGVGWQASCNSFGGNVHFTATKMEVEPAGGTLVGCDEEREEEDDWLVDFMDSDPEWHLEGERLRLVSDSGTIVLKGFEDPNSCPVSPGGGRVDFGNSGFGCEGALNLVTLHLEGKKRYLRGWKCRDARSSGDLSRVVCRRGERWLAVQGVDLASFGPR